MRLCRNGFKEKPEAEFGWKDKAHTALKPHCKECHAEIVRGYARQKRERQMAARWAELRRRQSTGTEQ